jgi:hypothetical protein
MLNQKINMDINDLHWHDGNITKFELLPNYDKAAQINIFADIYDDAIKAPGRDPVLLKCIDVKRFNCSVDLFDLIDNSGAGSINDCGMKKNILRFYLFGGFIEIEASEYSFEKC